MAKLHRQKRILIKKKVKFTKEKGKIAKKTSDKQKYGNEDFGQKLNKRQLMKVRLAIKG